jgi:hypothetical protein
VDVQQVDGGLELISQDPDAVPVDRQIDLTEQVHAALQTLEDGRGDPAEFGGLFKEFRDTTAQTARSRLTLELPDVRLDAARRWVCT